MPINFLLSSHSEIDNMDPRFRGNDDIRRAPPFKVAQPAMKQHRPLAMAQSQRPSLHVFM